MDLHHPLFESVALPLLLSFAASGLLLGLVGRVLGELRGRRWAGAGVAPAIIVASASALGWQLWPGSITEELPWIYVAAALLGFGLEGMRAVRRTSWLAGCVMWALVLLGLGDAPLAWQAAIWCAGAIAIAAVLNAPIDDATGPAALMVASLGLAAVAFVSGSALLCELGLSIAAAVAGFALWLWPRPRVCFGMAVAVVSVMAWLTLVQTVALLTPVAPEVLLLLALALCSGPPVRWALRAARRGRTGGSAARPAIDPLIVALVAALWAGAAIALALHGRGPEAAAAGDDPYYTPRWQTVP
ncbi:hypothetical protein QTH87_10200 [Variovorax sp. J22P168]|uniref:hypothetical protein n=1 Tax=Variovorax jilinensis TaxID=3053513 RepID=UPI002576C3B7|nr:hypothetical protein [Variovorax sp. J22P168]MDM0012800.1 hypothetical protein [Variovorax sp. J22P168]